MIELEVMLDHIHLFISAPPFEAPPDMVKVLKGVTAKKLFEKFPQLKKKEFWEVDYGLQVIMLEQLGMFRQRLLKNA